MRLLRLVPLILLLAFAGCGDDEPSASTPDPTAELRTRLQAAAQAAGLEVRFEKVAPAPCEGADGPTGTRTHGLRAKTTAADPAAALAAVRRHWHDQGAEITETRGVPGVFARDAGFTQSLRKVDGNTVVLSGGTPCV